MRRSLLSFELYAKRTIVARKRKRYKEANRSGELRGTFGEI